ncbi:related to TUL1-Golgi-localized RING-finger ubiquitin ligase [Sporisorium reilianum f. sp. reilianum]|uniref:RING-type E3 ubiquitin transferase n=1 Tax=Sporisorium reilianum f. sp. reilianum TaxID=72559 RepID=A0A2N8UFQ7_9BASI|nr:related to TUL1-Golgi-localized RING-finger ubiquitin ligase [Sporisorium reilianum f. sp. reilianum]
MQAHYSLQAWLVLVLVLLLTLPACTQASLLGTILFGKDTLEPVRAAIQQTEQMRQEVFGWYRHNATQQANFTVTPDPSDLSTLLPATYSGRSLVEPDGSYYSDVEGYYKGDWTGWDYSTQANRSLALDSRLNHTAAAKLSADWPKQPPSYVDGAKEEQLVLDRGDFEWLTIKQAHVDLHLKEEHLLEGNVSLITGSLSFTAPPNTKSSIDSVDFSLEGLHFIPTGSLFLHAVAEEAPQGTDVRTSLALIPMDNNQTANATISAIDKAFQLRIDMLQRIIASGSYDEGDSSADTPVANKHNCSLHVYAQFHSAGPHAQVQPQIDALEHEMQKSTGISTIAPPPLKLSLRAYSPECHFLLTSNELTGLLQTSLWKKAVHYAILYFVVLFVQTWLLVQQMEVTTTPSGLAKVSDKTWLAQSILDAYGCLVHLSVAVVFENETTLPLIACAFMSGMCFLAFGYRYTITIYRTQMDAAPSTPPAPAPATAPQPNPQDATATPAAAATDQAPATAAQPAGLVASTIASITAADAATASAEELQARRRGATILLVGVFLFMVGFFPILTVTLMLPFLYSFWIPQIYRNVRRGTRKAILKRCVVGTTLTRLFVPLYLLACPDNVMFSEPSVWGWALAGYLVVQAAVLVSQDLFGPHWFLRREWVPAEAVKGWEYHPPLPSDEEEAVDGHEYGDCAICLTAIESRTKRSVRRRTRSSRASYKSSRWFDLSSFSNGYDRIAEDAEDFEVDSNDGDTAHASVQLYPPEKARRSSREWDRPRRAYSSGGSSGMRRRLRSLLARGIRTALRWRQGLSAKSTLRRRRMDVMLAPCQHAFHTECLERWLEIKNECPSCRSVLPPV